MMNELIAVEMIKHLGILLGIKEHHGILRFPADPQKEFGISQDTFDMYIDELLNDGYIKIYLRSCGITPEGNEFLDNP